MIDILIKNGTVFDGTGKIGIKTDLAVKKGRIEAIKDMPETRAREVIDAQGLYISPGFIDIQNHSDSHGLLLNNPGLESFVSQGVTTIVVGQCGASLAPLPRPEGLKSLQKWGELTGVNADWQTFKQLSEKLRNKKFGTNILSFIGHATIRRGLIGAEARALTAPEIQQMAFIVEKALVDGAAGVSFGFQYGHELNTTIAELQAILAVIKKYDKIFSVHLRSQGENFLASVREALEAAAAAKVRTKISHFKAEGHDGVAQVYQAINLIEQALQSGTNVHFDLYPYATSWHQLYTFLPKWAYVGGFQPMLERLNDKHLRLKILQDLSNSRNKLVSLRVSQSPKVKNFIGQTVNQIARNQKISPEEAVVRILSANHGQAIVFDQDIEGEELTFLLKHPLSFVASDGVAFSFKPDKEAEMPHPRCFGTFPRFLRLMRPGKDTKQLLKWEEGIFKVTGGPAAFLNLTDRGVLKSGKIADIAIFDPNTIADMSLYENPYRKPAGLRYVITNGEISLFEGQLTGLNSGKFLEQNA